VKRKTKVLLCLLIVTSAGCQLLRNDQKAELVASAEIFAATVNVLTELKAQGQLGDDEIEDIGAMIHLGEKYLLQWRAAVDAGEEDADAMTAFRMILSELAKTRSKHHGDIN
jgi:hypothetical protein